MKYLIFLILAFQLQAQTFEALTVGMATSAGYTRYNQMKDRMLFKQGDPTYRDYSKKYHTSQVVTISLTLGLGVESGVRNKDNWVGYAKDAFLLSATYWNISDGVYNWLNGNSFYYQSPNTTSTLEPLGKWYIKLSLWITAILIYYLL